MARLAATCASLALLVGVIGCGDDGTPVAHVGDAKITRAQLVRQLGSVDVTPDLKGCVARFKALGDGGQPLGTPAERCRYEHTRELTSALATLIHTQWVRQEAKAEGIELTDAERKKARTYFGGDKVDDDLVETVALDDKLRAKLAHVVVSASEVDAMVEKLQALHDSKLDVQVVGAASETDALAARRYLDAGATFAQVASRYGAGAPVRAQIPKDPRDDQLTGYRLGEPLRAAVFAAPQGSATALVGPVESNGRFYVFNPGARYDKHKGETPEQLRAQVKSDLRVASQGAAYERILAQRWLRKTRCEKGYVVNGGQIMLGGGVAFYYSTAGCGNFVPFKTPPPN